MNNKKKKKNNQTQTQDQKNCNGNNLPAVKKSADNFSGDSEVSDQLLLAAAYQSILLIKHTRKDLARAEEYLTMLSERFEPDVREELLRMLRE